jgi:hypothetical protein
MATEKRLMISKETGDVQKKKLKPRHDGQQPNMTPLKKGTYT